MAEGELPSTLAEPKSPEINPLGFSTEFLEESRGLTEAEKSRTKLTSSRSS
jgi:hypothetical protein